MLSVVAGEEVEGECAEAGGEEDTLVVKVEDLVHLTQGKRAGPIAEENGGLGERVGGDKSSATPSFKSTSRDS